MKATKENIQAVVKEVMNQKTRSAWSKGVQAYALELLEQFEEWRNWSEESDQGVLELDEKTALNGAQDWVAWAYGGCGLVYDSVIAERLCTPLELRKTKGGMYPPAGVSSWLLIEGRAVRQAWQMIADAVCKLEA